MPIQLYSLGAGGQGSISARFGWSDMVYSFFSSVSYNLEGQGKWGSRFPKLLIDLCDYGAVAYEDLDVLDKELGIVFRELQKFPLSAAVYDIQEPWLPMPWEATPGEIANLAYAWETPRGEPYQEVFFEAIRLARYFQSNLGLLYGSVSSKDKPKKGMKRGHEFWVQDRGKSVPKD